MRFVISIGHNDAGDLDYNGPDGSGRVWRKGFALSWSRIRDNSIVFDLCLRIKLKPRLLIEHEFVIREEPSNGPNLPKG